MCYIVHESLVCPMCSHSTRKTQRLEPCHRAKHDDSGGGGSSFDGDGFRGCWREPEHVRQWVPQGRPCKPCEDYCAEARREAEREREERREGEEEARKAAAEAFLADVEAYKAEEAERLREDEERERREVEEEMGRSRRLRARLVEEREGDGFPGWCRAHYHGGDDVDGSRSEGAGDGRHRRTRHRHRHREADPYGWDYYYGGLRPRRW
ncbi:hypothetical protein N3K66_004780 [Trichothecium roseum]|uniref:Uncharacterized protein n=1 Tax=Trichothecium roseum TaxID=47278 RepID=A0ACC0V262_9HYPO|nr:hypothetical protein N3K66_004780 [Trichothecium roseum]